MAVRVPRSAITADQAKKIVELLTFHPKVDGFAGGPFGRFNAPSKPPIQFYQIDNPTGDISKADVLLPFMFAWQLLGKVPNQDREYPLTNFSFKGTLFDHQIPVEQEAFQHLSTKATANIFVYPGFGKTAIAASLSSKLYMHVLVIVPREFLCNQWRETYKTFTTATQIYVVGNDPPPREMPQITICMDTRVHILTEEHRRKIGLLIIDEAHTACTPCRVPMLLSIFPRFIILETATYERRDLLHHMLFAMTGTHSVTVKSTKPFEVIKLCTGIEPIVQQTPQGRLDYNTLLQSLTTNEERNKIILEIVEKNPEQKIMILTRYVDHVDLLYKALKEKGEKVDYFCGTKKSYKDGRVLVSTYSKAGTGFDQATACADYDGVRIGMLIMATSVKDLALVEQSVGRAFRHNFPVIIDMVDENGTLVTHYKNRCKWYKSRNGTIREIQMIPEKKTVKTLYTADGTPTQAIC